jgi:hypothetical protein
MRAENYSNTQLLDLTITILNIIRRPVFFFFNSTFQRLILSPFSGGTYSVGPNR